MKHFRAVQLRRLTTLILLLSICANIMPASASFREPIAQEGPTGEMVLANEDGMWLVDVSTGEKRLIKKEFVVEDLT